MLVSLGAAALGRERFSPRRAVALAAATAGIALALTGGGTGVIDPLGVGLALASALIYALYVLASSSLLGTTDPFVLAASVSTGAAITFLADAAIHGQLAPRGGVTGIGLVIAVALSSSVLGTSAFMAGVRRLGASTSEHRFERRARFDRRVRVRGLRRPARDRSAHRRRPRARVRSDPRAQAHALELSSPRLAARPGAIAPLTP